MDSIINKMDDYQDKALEKVFNNELFEYEIPVEDMNLPDLEKCEKAIRFCQSVTEATNLAIALSVRHIVVDGLYKEHYDTHTEYFRNADERLNMDKQKASWYLNSGIAYYSFRSKLDDAGFRPEGDFSKLVLLPKAIEDYGETAAIKALCSMSVRAFKEYVNGPAKKQLNFTKVNLNVHADDTGIFVEDKQVVSLKDVQEIVEKGSEPFLIGIDSKGEKAAIKRFLKDFRSKK